MNMRITDPEVTAAIDEVRTAAGELRNLAESVRRHESAAKRFDVLGSALEQASSALGRAQSGFESFVSETRSVGSDLNASTGRVAEVVSQLGTLIDRVGALDLSRLSEQVEAIRTAVSAELSERARTDAASREAVEQLSGTIASQAQQSRIRDEELLKRIEAQGQAIEAMRRQIGELGAVQASFGEKLEQLLKRKGFVF